MMFNPFKYKPVSQQDDEDEDVLYQGKNIPLSNLGGLGEANSNLVDDEVELELPRMPPTERGRTRFTLCIVLIAFILFVSLCITLIVYAASPLNFFNGQLNSTVTQSVMQVVTSLMDTVTPTMDIATSSSTTVTSRRTGSLASSGTQTNAGFETTITKMSNNELQSTASATPITAMTTVLIVKQTSESMPSVSPSLGMALLTTPARNAELLQSSSIEPTQPSILQPVTLMPTQTEGKPSDNVQILNTTISTSSVEISVAVTVSSSVTIYPSVVSSYNQSTENSVSTPTNTSFPEAQNGTVHWNKIHSEVGSESTPFVIDVNNDGIDDVIYSYSYFVNNLDVFYCPSNTDYENACMKDAGYPVCGAVVVAVNGLNGEVIWSRNMTRPVFGIHCVMDVDDDDETDCFVIGRYHQWDTIDKATGDMIWEADKSIGYPGYNFYYPLPLEDFDGDGVVDILNIHGGDQSYGPEETNRSPALIVILSGKTGKKLIDPIVVPDGHESYMSPVRYMFGNKDVVLFGTGGETIAGSLWAITVDSIKEFINSQYKPFTSSHGTEYVGCRSEFAANKDRFRPKYDERVYQLEKQNQKPSVDCPSLGQHLPITNKYKLCLYELYHSSSKGMIIPPVIIDMNSDNMQDLIIQSFGGHVLCLDGIDGKVLWDRHIPGSESYK